MKNLRITLVQTNLIWEKPEENLELIRKRLIGLRKNATDLIILPEMFTSGFTMNALEVAESMSGKTIAAMKLLSKEKNAVICGSVIVEECKKYYNRLLWITPGGDIKFYDKRHLFRMANEQHTFTAGTEKLTVDLKGWKICPLVCYDLRFPVWSRSRGDIDVIIYVANWPARRSYAWKHLLIARAIENQCFVAGVNRVGKDGNGIPYNGNSVLLDPMGQKINISKSSGVFVETITLDYKVIDSLRRQFPVMKDSDDFKLIN